MGKKVQYRYFKQQTKDITWGDLKMELKRNWISNNSNKIIPLGLISKQKLIIDGKLVSVGDKDETINYIKKCIKLAQKYKWLVGEDDLLGIVQEFEISPF